jgi:hypothetical protein
MTEMTDVLQTIDKQDAAWASFIVPLPVNKVIEFCQDITRLLRINPYLEFSDWKDCGNNCYQFKGRNLSQEPAFEIDQQLKCTPQQDGVLIEYTSGLKTSTRIRVENHDNRSKITLTEEYATLSESEKKQRLHEVDKSLVKWAEEIQAYLLHWKRWSWLMPYRWYMKYIWQPMKPVARRITYIILIISVIEVALIMLGVAIYFAEYA